jgi:hypothetical protein
MKKVSLSILLVFILSLFGFAAVALAQSEETPQPDAAPTLPEPASNVEKKTGFA